MNVDKWGQILADRESGATSSGVFAGGDAVTGPDLVVTAMTGCRAAASIHEYLKTRNLPRAGTCVPSAQEEIRPRGTLGGG